MKSVQRIGSKVHEGVTGASVVKKQKSMEAEERYFVRDGGCLSLRRMYQIAEKAAAPVPRRRLLDKMQCVVLENEWMALFVDCVREQMPV